ncbi:MAG: type IV pilus secretin PilQ [Desulfobacterales bacterium]|nr:type IV pilus secretin PilQ [Desulfobacterales bacterium]
MKPIALIILAMVITGLLTGCAGKKKMQPDPFLEKWKNLAVTSKGHSPSTTQSAVSLPSKAADEASKDVAGQTPEAAPKEGRPLSTSTVTMRLFNTDLAVALRALAKSANQNILISDAITGKVNLNIEKAPWDQVFTGILRTYGLSYVWEGDMLRIMTRVDFENDLKEKSQRFGMRLTEPLSTQIIRISYAEVAKLKENLEKFLTLNKDGKPIGTVMVDTHTNSLIINAIKDDIEKFTSMVKELDRPTYQILIEGHIVETTQDMARQLGVQWGGLYHGGSPGKNYWITPGANSEGISGGSISDAIAPTSGLAADFPAELGGAGLTLGYAAQTIGRSILNVQLSALQKDGKLNILSSPSITTVDNQIAFTENGTRVPYVSTDKDGKQEVKFEEVVLRLEIKPHVIDGNVLKMEVIVKKDEVDDSRNVAGNPYIIKKQTNTTLIVRNGETIVISGLSKQKNTDTERGVPALKDIPLLGSLFRGTGTSNSMEEVLIFITPHILDKHPSGQQPVSLKGSTP